MRLDFSDFTVLVMVSELYHATNFTKDNFPCFRTVFSFGILDEYPHYF
jgi:hypothetical protein